MFLEHQRVLAHEGVADDPQEDAEARETGDDGEEGDQRIAEWPSGREDRPREATYVVKPSKASKMRTTRTGGLLR